MSSLDPSTSVAIASSLFVVVLAVAVYMTVKQEKYKIDVKIIMGVWDLVKFFGGMVFGFLLGGSGG